MTFTEQVARVECPRCHKVWTAHQGVPEVDCNCHTYCQYGEKPADCTLVAKTSGSGAFTGDWKWPSGLHNDEDHEGDDTQARTYWCSTHSVYSSKVPLTIKVDWHKWRGKRAKNRLRMSKGNY